MKRTARSFSHLRCHANHFLLSAGFSMRACTTKIQKWLFVIDMNSVGLASLANYYPPRKQCHCWYILKKDILKVMAAIC